MTIQAQPQFKTGDKVKLNNSTNWMSRQKYIPCKVLLVGEYDTSSAGGIPDSELHLYGLEPQPPKLVYAYNIQRLSDGAIYAGVPEFYLGK
jgi:hypothetical protein